jgi:hypothetical protein
MEGDQYTVTIDTATKKLTFYSLPGSWGQPGFVALDAEGDIKPISMQASIDADKVTQWEGVGLPYDGSINRITGAFVVTIPFQGFNPKGRGLRIFRHLQASSVALLTDNSKGAISTP